MTDDAWSALIAAVLELAPLEPPEPERPPGAQIHALAVALKQPAIIAAVVRALPDSEEANRLRRAWERLQEKHQGSDLARTLDLQLDRQVSAVHDRLASLIKERSGLSAAAQTMMEQSFPRDLAHHVNAPHIEQAGHNLNLLTVLKECRTALTPTTRWRTGC